MADLFASSFQPTLAAARARIAAVRPPAYARTRNALDGAVTQLSPYITHGFVSLTEVLSGVAARHALDVQHKFVYELGWRAYFRHVWQHRGDGDLASNHLSWQWVAATGSRKPYLFNAESVARYAPATWHSPGSVIDTGYEALDQLARQWPDRLLDARPDPVQATGTEPAVHAAPPPALEAIAPDADSVAGRDVWLVHPWNLGELPAGLPADALVLGLFMADFHRAWPWSERRWRFVADRMAQVAPVRWHGDAAAIGAALKHARRVRCVDEPHLAPWLSAWADRLPAPTLFPSVDRRCDSFSQWWHQATRGLSTATDLLSVHEVPAC